MLTEQQTKQRDLFLKEFCKLQRTFWEEGDYRLSDYWKGQLMGMCKACRLYDPTFDEAFWLSRLI